MVDPDSGLEVQGFNPQGVQPVVGVATVSEVTLQLRLVLFGLETRETLRLGGSQGGCFHRFETITRCKLTIISDSLDKFGPTQPVY